MTLEALPTEVLACRVSVSAWRKGLWRVRLCGPGATAALDLFLTGEEMARYGLPIPNVVAFPAPGPEGAA